VEFGVVIQQSLNLGPHAIKPIDSGPPGTRLFLLPTVTHQNAHLHDVRSPIRAFAAAVACKIAYFNNVMRNFAVCL
jgi:hypothetical protein